MFDKVRRSRTGAGVMLAASALLMLVGCSTSSLFPVANQHPANWVQAHGLKVQAAGGADKAKVDNGMTCTMCHSTTKSAVGIVSGSKGADHTCFTCHQEGPTGSPHQSDFTDVHGAYVRQSGGFDQAVISHDMLSITDQTCNVCHTAIKAEDGSIPASPKASSTCFTCHAGGPSGDLHGPTWMLDHQKAVFKAGDPDKVSISDEKTHVVDQTCNTCHTTKRNSGGEIAMSPAATTTCFSCHVLRSDMAPHPATERWRYDHAVVVKAAGGADKAYLDDQTKELKQGCNSCHTVAKDAQGKIPPSPIASTSCFTCHPDTTVF